MGTDQSRELESLLAQAERTIAQLKARQQLVLDQDPVTGLLHVREFCARAEIELARAQRHGRDLSLALLDLDDFTALAAQHGADAAESILSCVGELLARFLRVHDIACRPWGDEYVLVLPETNLDGARMCAERLLLELATCEAGPVPGVGASVGITAFDGTQSFFELVDAATRALDEARAFGSPIVDAPAGAAHRRARP